MIARNDRNQIKKRLKKQQAQSMAHKYRSGQVLLNVVLWQLVKNVARGKIEDFDESLDCSLTLPKEVLEQVPANFGLKLDGDEDSVTVIATFVKPKGNIVLPDGSPAG